MQKLSFINLIHFQYKSCSIVLLCPTEDDMTSLREDFIRKENI